MISYIRGRLVDTQDQAIIIENQNIGYRIFVPASLLSEIPPIGEEMQVYTYLYVREDAIQLYGFLTKDDLYVFRLLLGVSGIGPKGALGVLSVITPDELRYAILAGDSKTIAKAPGIGAKTAQKVIIELKDKLSLEDITGQQAADTPSGTSAGADSPAQEAILALTALGYTATEAARAVRNIQIVDDMDSEQILKEALKKLI